MIDGVLQYMWLIVDIIHHLGGGRVIILGVHNTHMVGNYELNWICVQWEQDFLPVTEARPFLTL